MGLASIVLNVLSVISLPMVIALGVMTTDSPATSSRHFRILTRILGVHLGVVIGSVAGSWRLRSDGRPGGALLSSLAPAAWLVLIFAGMAFRWRPSPSTSEPGGEGPRSTP